MPLWRNEPGYEILDSPLKHSYKGCREGSAVKSTDCPSRDPVFNFQQPHGDSEPSILGSDALSWHKVYRVLIYIKKINKSLKITQNKRKKHNRGGKERKNFLGK